MKKAGWRVPLILLAAGLLLSAAMASYQSVRNQRLLKQYVATSGADAAERLREHLPSPAAVVGEGMLVSSALAALVALAQARRRGRHEVQAGQAQLAAIVDSSTDAIIGKDLSGRITSWNRGAQRLFGHTAEQALGRTVAELLVPPHLQHEEAAILGGLAAGAAVPDVETQRLHQDGHLIDVWVAVAPVRHPDGTVIGAAKVVRDITERKAAELRVHAAKLRLEDEVAQRTAQLRDANLMLNNVLDAATGVAIIACALDGTITLFNRGAERMLGYQADELLRRTTPEFFHDPYEVAARAAELSAQEGTPVSGMRALVLMAERCGSETREWTYVRRDGSRVAVSLIVTAMVDGGGGLAGYLGVAMDITQRRQLLSSLQQAKEQALAASAAKSNFLANMSHEIRTPMNAVLGMLELVQRTALAPRQRDYLAKADSAGRALLQLLNDVLDYSKIEAGKLKLDPHPFDPDAMLRDLAVVLGGNLGDKQVDLVFDLDPQLPSILIGDRLRLLQVLINLAGNALKFTERGHVKVALQVLARTDGQLRLRVAVSDSGIGISADQQARIFDGFTQAEASISRRYGGTGLGLFICRRLLGLMESELRLDSQPGRGSCFWFELELGWAGVVRAPQGPVWSLLIAQPAPEGGPALQRMAAGLGWRATLAADGLTALQALDDARPDVILMASDLPGGSVLRERLQQQGQPPLVLLAPVCATAGTDAALGLPATPRMLARAVQCALHGPDPAALTPPGPTPQRLRGMRILLVEDNALNRQVAGELLSGEGALIELAENGRLALQSLLEAAQLPDVVLMDMQMPEMDGLEAARRIRAALGSALRIVAMTANAGEADRASCLAAGMNEHLGKPIDIEQLVRCLGQYAAAPAGPGPQPQRLQEESMPAVLARFGGNTALYLHTLAGFDSQSSALAAQVLAAVQSGAMDGACAALHTYKGLAATLGARGLAATAADLESRIKNGDCGEWVQAQAGLLALQGRQEMARLRGSAPHSQAPAAQAGALRPLRELDSLLSEGNMRAMEWVPGLTGAGGADLAMVANRILALDFQAARQALASAQGEAF